MSVAEPRVVAEAAAARPAPAGDTPWRRARRTFRRDRGAMVALGFLVIVALAAVLAPVVARHEPARQQLLDTFATPSGEHWLGTDDLGRDLFARLVYGARVSLRVSLGVVGLALLIAVPVGLVSGYVGGRVDNVLMRATDALLSFPPLVLALAIAGVLGPGLRNTVIALTTVMTPSFVRLVRGQTLAVRQETFVEASQAIGTPMWRILATRVLPHTVSPLMVQASIALGATLIAEASLSFLGLGVPPPDSTWGEMLRRAFNFVYTHGWQVFVPGLAIACTVLAFNTLGDGLRDALLGQGRRARRVRGTARTRLGITTVVREVPGADTPAPDPPTAPALAIRGLEVEFATEHGPVTVVDGVDLDVGPGEIVGLVGESGCGKTVTSLSVLRLVPSPPGRIAGGSVWFGGRDLLDCSFSELRRVRGAQIAMVFQDPMASLNPAFTVGDQLVEAQRLHRKVSRRAARERAVALLGRVGIPDARNRLDDHPHMFSGGMRQRALIAMALANDPKVLVADEPTTALDVTVQAQILDLLRDLRADLGMSILFVTHDLGVVADLCDRVAVMYAGQIVESAPVAGLFSAPRHPYTDGLLAAVPVVGAPPGRLASIPGTVPSPAAMPAGCRFAARCPYATDACLVPVATDRLPDDRLVRCVRHAELELGARR